jgi:hypothetical protein
MFYAKNFENHTDEKELLEDSLSWIKTMNVSNPLKSIVSNDMTVDSANKNISNYIDANFHKIAGRSVNMFDALFPNNPGNTFWKK